MYVVFGSTTEGEVWYGNMKFSCEIKDSYRKELKVELSDIIKTMKINADKLIICHK